MGIEFQIGSETEVIFVNKDGSGYANDYGWSESRALPAGSAVATACEEIADGIQEAGITLNMYHSEGAPGQVSS